ncbi:MAG: hypothetical protein Q9169_007590 [Polycauliona sp. 2 TL-2023]
MTSHLGKLVSEVEVASQGIGEQLSSRLDADIAQFEGSTASWTDSLSQMSQDLAGLRGIPATVTSKLEEFATAASSNTIAITDSLNALKLSPESKSQELSSSTIDKVGQTVKTSVLSAIEEKIAKPIESQGLTLKDVADVTSKTSEALEDSQATQQSNFDELVKQINGLSEDEQKRLKEIFIRTDKKLDDIAAQFEPLQLALEDLGANLPSDRQKDWDAINTQMASIGRKLTRLSITSSSSQAPVGLHNKRPSELVLDEPSRIRRRSSQQSSPSGYTSPIIHRNDSSTGLSGRTSPLSLRTDITATRDSGREVSQSQGGEASEAVEAGEISEDGEASEAGEAGEAGEVSEPILGAQAILDRIQFEGDDWTEPALKMIRGYLTTLHKNATEDKQPIKHSFDACAIEKDCMTCRMKKGKQVPRGQGKRCGTCHQRKWPCIRVELVSADSESSGKQWVFRLRQ